ncbi:cytochrome P450 4d2-like isoform X2 [Choristoneura fumiferana]|uniref:cytochrome P450 4d2-like isoform X2 n=1 Tax=Choristoneura fumiferana TaxID=7141 RepID=UPI003D155316
MYYLLLILAGFAWAAYCRFENRKIIELSRKLPGDLTAWPLIGHAYLFRGNHEDQMRIFQKAGRLTINRGGVASYWIGSRLYIIPIWRPRRKILAPTFSMKNLNRFVDVFVEQSSVTLEQLRPRASSGTFSMWYYLTTYTFDAVCETALGVKMNSQLQPSHPFLEALGEITQLTAARMVQPWLYSDWVYKTLPQYKRVEKCRALMYDFVEQVLKTKREAMKMNEGKPHSQSEADLRPKSFLEMLLDLNQFTDLEIMEEILVITAAGTDTSAVAASFTMVLLSRYPEIQDKLTDELLQVFGDSERAVTAVDLPRLRYLEAVIKESLRMYPPVPIIVRSVDNDTELPSGLVLVDGVGVLVNIWAMHRNPYYWGDDADVFRPERFLEPLKHPAQFVPFSYGLRNCIGYQYAMMSIKTVLATLLRQYRVLPPGGADQSNLKEPLRVEFDIMMKDVDKFQIQIENRFKSSSS